jgi:hypothetical protein
MMNYKPLIDALAEIQNLPLDSEGYGYKYTSLPKILEHVKPILKKYNLTTIQRVFTTDGLPCVETEIISEEGPLASSGVVTADTAGLKMNSVQAVGATITYLRRYSITALLGISGDEDTDAATDKGKAPKSQQKSSQRPKTASPEKAGGGASEKQGKMIYAIGKKLFPNDTREQLTRIAGELGIPSSSKEMSKKQASAMIEHLTGLQDQAKEEPPPPDDGDWDGGY